MHAQNLVINQCADRHTIEYILELLPYFDTVPPLAFIVKTVDSVYLPTLVVTPEHEKVLFVFDFIAHQQDNCLQRLFTSVHVVSQEEIVRFWWETPVLKKS